LPWQHYAAAAATTISIFCLISLAQHKLMNSNKPVVAWLSSNALISINIQSLTPGPVSTRMGDHLLAGKPSRYVASHLGRLKSLLPSVGR